MAIISNATTISDNGAFSQSLGSMVHIKTLTASASATLSFVDGTDGVVLDSTYPIYKILVINSHPSTLDAKINLRGSIDGGSSYGVSKTTTVFSASHNENDSDANLTYQGGAADLANSTSGQRIATYGVGNNSDDNVCGEILLFNPSSTTFVKHFLSQSMQSHKDTGADNTFVGGYFNTTSAVNAIRFEMSSGNIDTGKIKLYGIKDS